MSLVEKTDLRREAGNSDIIMTSRSPLSATATSYTDLDCNDDSPDENESIYNEICEMMDVGLTNKHEGLDVDADAPKLPPRSALRKTTHDVYLSSEEDASDFSDHLDDDDDDVVVVDADGVDGFSSPRRRSSYEKKARAVSVVFSGKPCLVELSPRRRTPSPFSTRSTYSNKSYSDRPPTPSSSTSSVRQTSTKSLPTVTNVKNTPFLHIDPFAHGSTYSLDMAPPVEEPAPLRKTRTHSPLARGLAKTLSLAKRRSRTSIDPVLMLSPRRTTDEEPSVRVKSALVSPPVTYESILEAAMGNSLLSMMTTPSPDTPLSPTVTTPTTEVHTSRPAGARKSRLFSGLVVRRQSVKFT